MAITVTKLADDLFQVEMAAKQHSISVLITVPKNEGRRIYSSWERETLARQKAQEIALDFAEQIGSEHN